MAKTYLVKYIIDTMHGAPVLNGVAGSLVALLDAFLIDGWGAVTPQSIVVAGGIATVTLNAGDSFEQDAVISVSGATPAALNGEHRVLQTTATTCTFATSAPDGAVSGTISVKYAPVGDWEVAYTATNKRAYRSSDPYGSRFYYRVDDTGTVAAQLRGYEQMTDVDTGTNPFPTPAQLANAYIIKSSAANATAVPYCLAADSRTVRLGMYCGNTASGVIRGFGDLAAIAQTPDPWAACVSVTSAASYSAAGSSAGAFDSPQSGAASIYCARDMDGRTLARTATMQPYSGAANAYSGLDNALGTYPAVDNTPRLSRKFVLAPNLRADEPGVLYMPQAGMPLAHGQHVTLADGRIAIALRLAANSTLSSAWPGGYSFLDITGPWR